MLNLVSKNKDVMEVKPDGMEKGYVKLWRKIDESDMFKSLNSKQRDVMLRCLRLANHQSTKIEINGDIIDLLPGQFITSFTSLADKCADDVSRQNVRTTLVKLEKWGFLTLKPTHSFTIISIIKWHTYQPSKGSTNTPTNTAPTRHQHSTNTPLTLEKNNNNINNNNNYNKEEEDKQKFIFSVESGPFKASLYLVKNIEKKFPSFKDYKNNPLKSVQGNERTSEKAADKLQKWSREMDLIHKHDLKGGDIEKWNKIKEMIDLVSDTGNNYKVQSPASLRKKQGGILASLDMRKKTTQDDELSYSL